MSRRSSTPPLTRGVLLRGFGLALAVALGAVSVWLVVTGATTTPKRIELGVLAGLWSALVGAFSIFGPRRAGWWSQHELDDAEAGRGGDLVLRSQRDELERLEEAASRRAFEVRLEQLLRREVQDNLAREVAGLRAEIAQLRSELVEKVGGQLRLERIETTRVIGSDLEALQHEVRQLKAVSRDPSEAHAGVAEQTSVRHIVEAASVRPVSRQTADIEADVQPATVGTPVHRAETTGPLPRIDAVEPVAEPVVEPVVEPLVEPESSDRRVSMDELAGLPRLTPFTDLDPVEEQDAYTGRRRRRVEEDAGGRAGAGEGRRHRHDDDDGHDLLARLLAREGH